MSDYDQQSGAIDDRLNNPEVTPEEAVRPGFWGGLSPFSPVQGVASGAMEVGSVLAGGLPRLARALAQPTDIGLTGPEIQRQDEERAAGPQPEVHLPWDQPFTEWSNKISDEARAGAKAAMPDPRLTGSAANIVLGGSKIMTEATIMTALAGGNPIAGAGGLGAIQGVARYQDYRDQGVDDATAQKLALVQGIGAGAGMLIPGGVSAKWLANLTPARQMLTQLATGAASNTIQGGANRYVTSKILDDAGYHDMAEQSKVLDGEAIFTDLLTGGGFGMLHYLHSRGDIAQAARELASQDSTVADSARAAQDTQQIVERAPGVPVDIPSQAIHRAALEKASEQLLKDEPVNVGDITAPDVQTSAAEPPVPPGMARYYHGGAPEGVTGPLWFTSSRADAEGWASRAPGMRTWYTDVPRESPARGEGDLENGIPYPSRVELPAELANQRRPLTPAEPTFARPAENTMPVREMLHDEFQKAGVLDEWSKLEDLNDLLENRYEPKSVKPTETAIELPISQEEPSAWEEGGYSVGEEELTDEQRKAFENMGGDRGGPGDETGGSPVREGATGGAGGLPGEPIHVYRGSREPLTDEHFEPEALGHATQRPSAGAGVWFTASKEEAARFGDVAEHDLHFRNPKEFGAGDFPPFDSLDEARAYQKQLREEGYDGIILRNSEVGGPDHYIAFEPKTLKPATTESAESALGRAKDIADRVKEEAPKMFSAAAECASKTR